MRAAALLLLLASGCASLMPSRQQAQLIGQLDREVRALRLQNEALQAEGGAARGGAPSPIYTELVQVFAGSEVTVAREGSDVVVVIPAALLFSGWGLTLRAESAMTLDLLGTALKLHPELDIEVVGHMDDTLLPSQVRKQVGTIWELGAIRAAAVTRALIDTHGVESQRFFVGSRGAAQPIDTTDTSEGRMRNRRVELRLRKAQNR